MTVSAPEVNPSTISNAVESWFPAVARSLPWRRRRTRWRTFVSEIMLQQTQVVRVVEKFEPFLTRFPTPQALADAPESDVLQFWAGLGYYRRARMLHAAAKVICERHRGRVPIDPEALLALPGVGRYTAGAIASIAGKQAVPIVDGNVHRVLTRLWADPVAADDRAGQERTWRRATSLVEHASSPGRFNEGLMELGAVTCTPRGPACGDCPVRRHCGARRDGVVEQIPPPKQKTRSQKEFHYPLAVIRRGRIGMQQRPPEGRWGGLWQLPTVESNCSLNGPELRKRFRDLLGRPVELLEPRAEFQRVLTHRRITFSVFAGTLGPGRIPASTGIHWIPKRHDLPLGVAQAKTLEGIGWPTGSQATNTGL